MEENRIKEQRYLIPIRVTFATDRYICIPTDLPNQAVTVKASDELFAKFLRKIKASDNKTSPRSKRQLTYLEIVKEIENSTDDVIWVWSNFWNEVAKNSYYILN